MKRLFLNLSMYLVNFIRIGILFFVLLLLITFLSTNYIDNPKQYPTLMHVTHWVETISEPLSQQIKMAVPYKFQGTDYSNMILIVSMLLLAHICSLIGYKCQTQLYRFQQEKKYYTWRNKVSSSVSKEKMSEIDSKFAELNTTKVKTKNRKKILEEFAILKSQLDSMGQQLAFLAIDVVDSTGMKRHEDKHLVSYDFDRYNDLVSNCLKENGALKSSTTPDGFMSCFRTVDDAVNTAVDLLEKLKDFNLNQKKIKGNFQIRCGINAGFVYIDDETPLEQVSDRVIDIAGHMQKYAKPDSINIAASAIEPLKNRGGFSETTDVIDEQKVYEWSNK